MDFNCFDKYVLENKDVVVIQTFLSLDYAEEV